MRPVMRWTIWQRRSSIFWWSLGIAAFIIINLVFYPSFRNQTQLNQQLENLPQAAKSLFSDTGDFFSPQGYLSSQVFYLMMPMILGILSIGLGSSLIAKEEDAGTLELLLSRPISRAKLLFGKAAAGIFIVLIVGAVGLISAVIMCKAVKIDVPLLGVALATLASTVLALLFGAIAFCVTTIGRARVASIGVAALVAFGGYIIASLAGVVDWLKWPAKVLPYHYYQPGDMLHGHYVWHATVGFLVMILILGVISWIAFRRRDLNG